MGCFIDTINTRDLDVLINNDDNKQLTPQQCIYQCQQINYQYAGIQNGNECRCGQYYGRYGKVSDDECDFLCITSEKCGGNNRNSIYDTKQLANTGE